MPHAAFVHLRVRSAYSLLEGALNWAVGRVDADVTPNLATAAPGANTLPVQAPAKQ